MRTLIKQIVIWCIIATAYFIAIDTPLIIYARTTGEPPDFLVGLHHEFFILPFFSTMTGNELYEIFPEEQEMFAFSGGFVFYAGTGALLGLIRHLSKKSKHWRGIFYAILFSLLGYTTGVWLGGHPPIFLFLNPPVFFVGGYIFGILLNGHQDP